MPNKEKNLMEDLAETIATEPSLDDILSDAYDKAVSDDDSGPAVDTETQGTEEKKEAATSTDTEQSAGQPTEDDDNMPESEPGAEAATQEYSAPESWTGDSKAKWKELPEWAQAEFSKREGDFTKGIAKHAEGSKFAQNVYALAAQYPHITQGNPLGTFQNALQMMNTLLTGSHDQKAAVLQNLAQYSGTNPTQPQEADKYQDPDVADLRAQLQQMQTKLQQSDQAASNERLIAANKAIAEFEANNEHFKDVKEEVIALFNAAKSMGQQLSLKDAYEKAIWMNPAIREKLTTAANAEAEKKRLTEAKKAAKVAKKTAGTQLDGDSGVTTSAKKESLDETMSRVYDELNPK
jgi:hypothetical protein